MHSTGAIVLYWMGVFGALHCITSSGKDSLFHRRARVRSVHSGKGLPNNGLDIYLLF